MSDVPDVIQAAFADKPTLNAPELCRLLRMDPKTLRRHARDGNIRYVLKGFGESRPRREFTLSDVMGFLNKRSREECQSISRRVGLTTSMTSNGEVVGFTERHMKRNGGLRRRPSAG